jgi:hypothetical protein
MHPDLPLDLLSSTSDQEEDYKMSDNEEENVEDEEEMEEGTKMSVKQIV